MRLVADLHIAPRTVEYLKSLGHGVVRVSDVLSPRSPDRAQDLDFSAEIAVSRQAGPSLILLRLSSSVNRVLADILPALEQDVQNGALITVEDHRVRRRRLPLSSP